MSDLLENKHILAALYFTDLGHYLFKSKQRDGSISIKSLDEPTVAAAFSHCGFDSGWMSEGIVRTGISIKGGWYVYFQAPRIETIQIEGRGKEPAAYVKVPVPATVMLQYGKESFLFCLGSMQIFDPKAEAFHAPFANIYEDGRICWGKNRPKTNGPKDGWVWKLFFMSPFNQDLANRKSKKYPENINQMLKNLDGKKKYPIADLISFNKNIGTVIDRIIKEER